MHVLYLVTIASLAISEISISPNDCDILAGYIYSNKNPFCNVTKNDYDDYKRASGLTNLQLSYRKDSIEYKSLSMAQKKKRKRDDFELSWVVSFCPEVMEYFFKVPYNDFFDGDSLLESSHGNKLSNDIVFTKQSAMTSTCLLRVVEIIALSINMTWALIAGAQLGSMIHGGPIPWDDDVDIIIDFHKKTQFIDAVNSFHVGGIHFNIFQGYNALKMSVNHSSYIDLDEKKAKPGAFNYPFLDIFSFRSDLTTEGARRRLGPHKQWPTSIFHQIRPYFYGGIILPGLSQQTAHLHYDIRKCIVSKSSHRSTHQLHNRNNGAMNCCELSKHFPFVHQLDSIMDPNIALEYIMIDKQVIHVTKFNKKANRIESEGYVTTQDSTSIVFEYRAVIKSQRSPLNRIIPTNLTDLSYLSHIWNKDNFLSTSNRMKMLVNREKKTVHHYTHLIPNINQIEINNQFSPNGCHCMQSKATDKGRRGSISSSEDLSIKIVNYNALRGTSWQEFLYLIQTDAKFKHVDVIMLNEVDIGMARSEQLHVVRMLAYALQMNYAWGLEFVELTNGDKEEQENTPNKDNTFGLHGNAILTKCLILEENAEIIRSKINEKYFSSVPSFVNANGYERRIGGRMGLFVFIKIQGSDVDVDIKSTDEVMLLGSVHKLQAEEYGLVRDKIASAKNVNYIYISGDQSYDTCKELNLKNVDDRSQFTFPSSCNSFGNQHGDTICYHSSYVENIKYSNHPPCVFIVDKNYSISDHSITIVTVNK